MNRTPDAPPPPVAAGGDWPHRRRDLLVASLAATAMHGLMYLLANRYPLGPVRQLAFTVVDEAVPFWPWTVFIYLSDYFLLFASFQCCRTRASADRFLLTLFLVIATSTLLHWAFPVAFPRDRYPVPADLAWAPRRAMELLRFFDAATSCLPSLHVGAAVLAPMLISRESPRASRWLLGWALLICLSTLTTKQHYLLDVVAGVAVALVAFALSQQLARRRVLFVNPVQGDTPR